jgi:hypothetical protein
MDAVSNVLSAKHAVVEIVSISIPILTIAPAVAVRVHLDKCVARGIVSSAMCTTATPVESTAHKSSRRPFRQHVVRLCVRRTSFVLYLANLIAVMMRYRRWMHRSCSRSIQLRYMMIMRNDSRSLTLTSMCFSLFTVLQVHVDECVQRHSSVAVVFVFRLTRIKAIAEDVWLEMAAVPLV